MIEEMKARYAKIEIEHRNKEDRCTKNNENKKGRRTKSGENKKGKCAKSGEKENVGCSQNSNDYPEAIKRGIEISFSPSIFRSIRSSLTHPKVYLSGEMTCHRVIACLNEKARRFEELEKALGDEDLELTLKSLIFAKIVIKVKEEYAISPYLL